ncbi:hypothetical protein PCANC_22772 [Puccinia coronata f. sp. avenae]|uniref:Uncharacterized protein n=1 Tax=Puccinia coronata f. sp. avenae TaxID=200324 RepID=A0A2N5S9Y7_9BASI|nr:hypothetical protein PCANC_22772 [Puccinia coronata f. sp. avenae]
MRPSDSNSGAGPPSESLTDSNLVALAFWPPSLNRFLIHSVARRPSLNRMAASDVNSDATIRASIAGKFNKLDIKNLIWGVDKKPGKTAPTRGFTGGQRRSRRRSGTSLYQLAEALFLGKQAPACTCLPRNSSSAAGTSLYPHGKELFLAEQLLGGLAQPCTSSASRHKPLAGGNDGAPR